MSISLRNTMFTLIMFTFPNAAFAQSADCEREVKNAIQNCGTRVSNAKNSNVSSYGGADGMSNGGGSQAAAAGQIGAALRQASRDCHENDLKQCTDACNSALKNSPPPATQAKIKSNMGNCYDQINAKQEDATSAATTMASVAQGSQATQRGSGDSFADSKSDVNPEDQGDVQKTDSYTLVGRDATGRAIAENPFVMMPNQKAMEKLMRYNDPRVMTVDTLKNVYNP